MNNSMLTTKPEIKAWLDKAGISKYTLRPDPTYGYRVDVKEKVNLKDLQLNRIPVKFGVVQKSFDCSFNQLTSLEGAPDEVKSHFYCDHNQLITLQHSPIIVGHDFYCSDNALVSLLGCTRNINKDFLCNHNHLRSLLHGPETVGGFYNCSHNSLTSLQHSPHMIHSGFNCDHNPLVNLEFCPVHINGLLYLPPASIESHLYSPQKVGGMIVEEKGQMKIIDFNFFYQQHREHVKIQKEKSELDSTIAVYMNQQPKKSHKI